MTSRHAITTIGQAAETAGVGVETIRFYERKGLIEQPPKPVSGGFRDYPPDTMSRIRVIREAQNLGFSLAEVRDLLSLRADPDADCADMQRRAEEKRAQVRRKIEKLEKISVALDRLIKACPGKGALGACSIIGALEGDNNQEGAKP